MVFRFFLCSATPDTGSGLARARSRRRSAHLALDFEAHDGPFEVVRNHAHVGIDSARRAQFDFQLHHEAFARLQPPLARKVAPDEGRRLDLAHDEGRTPLVAQHEAVLEPRAAGLLPEIEVAALRAADGRTPGPPPQAIAANRHQIWRQNAIFAVENQNDGGRHAAASCNR